MRQFLEINPQEQNQRENHQLRIKEKKHTGVIKAPFAAEAARRLHHSPEDDERNRKLPDRGMRRSCQGKAGQAQADCKCAKAEQKTAGKRPLAQTEEDQAWSLHPSI